MRPWAAAAIVGIGWGVALWGPGGIVAWALALLLLPEAIRGAPWADAARGLLAGLAWQALALGWLPASWRAAGVEGADLVPVLWLVQALPVALGFAVAGAVRGPTGLAAGGIAAAALAGLTPIPLLPTFAAAEVGAVGWGLALVGRVGLTGLAWAGARSRWTPAWILAGLLYSAAVPSRGTPLRVGVVEPGIGALDGRRASTAPDREARLLAGARALGPVDLIVTPEGGWPGDPGDPGGARRAAFEASFAALPPIVVGADAPPWNALVALEGGRVTDRFEKHRLLPIGERALGGLGRDRYRIGAGPRRLVVAGVSLGPLICYEDLFASDVRAAASAEVLIAPSNDAWGGAGAWAHLAASRVAAIEAGRWVVRPTTSGISAVIDPAGRLAAASSFTDRDAHPEIGARIATVTVRRLPATAPGPWMNLVLPWLVAAALAAGLRRR